MSNVQLVLLEPAKAVLSQIVQFLINVLLVVLVLLIGWLVARAVKTIVTKALRIMKLDVLSDRLELDSLLEKGGIKYSISELLGTVSYWLVLLVTFVVAMNVINLTVAAALLEKVVLFIPNIIAAVFILVLGLFVGTLLRNIVLTAANNAGVVQANMISKLAEVVVIAFAAITAIKQLGIDVRLVELLITITLSALGLAAGLAFGLGCKDLAGKATAEFLDKIKSKK